MDVKRSRHVQAAIKWREEGTKKGNFSASMEEVGPVLCLSVICSPACVPTKIAKIDVSSALAARFQSCLQVSPRQPGGS